MRTSLLTLFLVVLSFGLFAQNVGDFRSRQTGPTAWNSTTTWQVFNGSTWVNTTAYPGQTAGTYSVLIRPGHIITNPTMPTNLGAVTMGTVTVSGVLRLTGNADYTLRTAALIVTPGTGNPPTGGGQIQFQGNNILYLPTNATISVSPGGISHSNCTAAQRIVIGNIVLSTCNGNGPNDPVSFEDLMNARGSLISVINSQFPDCSGTATQATLIPEYLGLPGSNLSFQWEIITPANTTITSTSNPLLIDLDLNGNYTIKLTYTTTYTGNTYTNSRTIIYSNKVTVWNGSSWSNGSPNLDTRVIIDGDYSGASFNACSLKVNSGANLIISQEQHVEVDGIVVIETGGNLTVNHQGTLIQNQEVENIGNITYKRTATGVHRFDYVYWSSPVSNFNISDIVGTSSRFFWNPAIVNANGSQGNWVQYTSGSMEKARGYIVRAPNTFPTQQQSEAGESITTEFFGVPHNGTIEFPVSRGNLTGIDDNYNLTGNPYPSSINIADFLIENSSVIEGNVRLWTHGGAPDQINGNPFYGDFVYNYNPDDYWIISLIGSNTGPDEPSEIDTGVGFFVVMKDGPSAATQNITFNNSMRRKNNNNIFFRQAITQSNEKHRIWLDLVNANMNVSRTLIGYTEGATHGKDGLYDASQAVDAGSMTLYTHIDNHDLCIQGRGLPFMEEDFVALGVNVPQTGSYSIAIGEVDGLFENPNQAIFVEDLELGIIHNLRQAPYEFIASQGNHKNRFVLRFNSSETLSISSNTAHYGIVITNQTEGITVFSTQEPIAAITVYNILGQQVASYPAVGSLEKNISLKNLRQQIGVVSITLENGQVINKKAAF